jgi:predicted ATPase/DNA-binding SARP family transcriptional activator
VRVLGELAVMTTAGEDLTLPRGLPRQLVGYLATHSRPVTRREVLEHLWPDVDEKSGRRRLRTTLWEVQRAVRDGDAPLVDSSRTSLSLDTRVVVDIDDAEALLAAGAAEAALRLLEPGLCAELDQEWAMPARRRAEGLRHDALTGLVEASPDPKVALGYARRRLELDPLSEAAHQDVIRCLARAGDRGGAFAAYAELRHVLDLELGASPSAESRRLLAELTSDDGPAHRPPTGSVHLRRPRLPLPLTPMIGRDGELADVVGLLHHARVVTITGIGGMGKSRLALATAERFEDHSPVTVVELAATRQPDTCEYVVAAQLGVVAGQGRSITEAIATALDAQPGLLVLDNCEHVREHLRTLVTEVGSRCRDTRILATSRERLGVPGEHVVPLAPLAVPSAEEREGDSLAAPSVQVLIDAAVRRGASTEDLGDPAALAGLARGLGGIPLALELAGGLLTTFQPATLTQSLERGLSVLTARGSGRHDSLASTFDWSLSTLDPGDRHLLGLMATCPGQLPVDLIERLAGAMGAGVDPDLALVRLVEAGLVRASSQPNWSYSMLEPIRFYAEERLDPADRRLAKTALLSWAMAFCDRMGALIEDDEITASAAFDHCFPLIRQAVYTARALDDFDAERHIVHGVDPWATWRPRFEAWNWVISLANDPKGRSQDALTYRRAAMACSRQGRLEAMRDFTDRCVRADPDGYEANSAELQLAWSERRYADVVDACSRLEERSPAATAGHRGLCAASLLFLGELDAALDMAQQSKAFADRTGMPTVKSLATEMVGRAYAARRRAGIVSPDPHPFLLEARTLAASVGSVEMQAGVCTELARQAILDNRYVDAVEPLLFISRYWLTGAHRNPEDDSVFRLLIEALQGSGRTDAAARLTELVDGGRLTLRELGDAVADTGPGA